MPLRGESVGTAYVRILADGTGLPESIRDEMEGADDEISRAGTRQSKEYQKSFAKEMDKDQDISGALNRALARNDFVNTFFKSQKWKLFRNRLQKEFGDVGGLAGRRMVEDFRRKGNLDGLVDAVENIIPRIAAATDDIAKAQSASFDQIGDDSDRMAARIEDGSRRIVKATEDVVEIDTERLSVNQRLRDAEQRLLQDRTGNRVELERLTRTLDAYDLSVRTSTTDVDRNGRAVGRFSRFFRSLNTSLDTTAGLLGRAFGKGSRSEFLNFIGSVTQGMFKVISLAPKMVAGFAEFVSLFTTLQRDANTTNNVFTNVAAAISGVGAEAAGAEASLGEMLATGIPGLIAFAAAAVLVVVALGPIVALISSIAAALTALVGSLFFGLIGALAPLLGLIVPLAAAFGVVVLAMKDMKDEGKKITKTLKPLTDAFKVLERAVGGVFFSGLADQAEDIANVLRGLKPLLVATANGILDSIRILLGGLNGPGFKEWSRKMQVIIPEVLRDIAHIIRNLGSAFGTIFLNMAGQTDSFLGSLRRMTREFRDFVGEIDASTKVTGRSINIDLTPRGFGSTGGGSPETKVQSFFDRAIQSAKVLFDLLNSIGALLGTIFTAGQDTGDNIFIELTGQIDQFNDFLKKNPAKLDEWFANGKATATAIGNMALALGDLFSTLDTPEGHESLKMLVQLGLVAIELTGLVIAVNPIRVFAGAIGFLATELGKLNDAFQGSNLQAGLGDIFTTMGQGIQNALDSGFGQTINIEGHIEDLFTKIDWGAVGNAVNIEGHLEDLFNKIDWGKVLDVITFNPVEWITSNISGPIGDAWNSINWGAIFGGSGGSANLITAVGNIDLARAVAKMLNPFDGLAGKIADRIGKVHIKDIFVMPNISGFLVSPFAGVAGLIFNAMRKVHVADIFQLPDVRTLLVAPFAGVAGLIITAMNIAHLIDIFDFPTLKQIASPFAGTAGAILNEIGDVVITITADLGQAFADVANFVANLPHPSIHVSLLGLAGGLTGHASGGIFNKPTVGVFGEAGREALVPLDKPLNQVDPAVRALSAFARGLPFSTAGVGTSGRSINASGWIINSPTENVEALATEVVNQLVAVGY